MNSVKWCVATTKVGFSPATLVAAFALPVIYPLSDPFSNPVSPGDPRGLSLEQEKGIEHLMGCARPCP